MAAETTRAAAEALDRADPLARERDRFVVADDDLIYLDGNSLGRLPVRAAAAVERMVHDGWGRDLIGGWVRWLTYPEEVGDRLGAAFLGAAPGQVVVGDSTTVNLYKLASAALDARPDRRALVVPAGEFPTDRYVLEGLAAPRGLDVRLVPAGADVVDALDADVAVLCLSMVDYRSGAVVDVAAITAAARHVGATVVWDLSHAVGAVPIELDRWGVELATGCSYKFLNGGPGAPAWLYVRSDVQHLRSPIWGWFGQREQFAMGPAYDPEPGIRRWLAGTPTVIALAAVDAAVADLAEIGIEALRAKGTALTTYAIDLADARLAGHGVTVATPRLPHRRGAHVALAHPAARELSRRLIDEHGVVPDFREPDLLRLGLAPAYTRFTDVWDGIDALAVLLAGGAAAP